MSRTNPYKQKRRHASKTLLLFGEGFNEEMFLKYLRSQYTRDRGIAVTIKKGKGGTADGIVIEAAKMPGAFDRKIVILDNDKPKTEMEKARREAKNRNIELIENTPCLEFLLLSIMNSEKKPTGKNSVWCKNEFESKYLKKQKRGEPDEYAKLFPKDLLDKQRSKIEELNKLIAILENKE